MFFESDPFIKNVSGKLDPLKAFTVNAKCRFIVEFNTSMTYKIRHFDIKTFGEVQLKTRENVSINVLGETLSVRSGAKVRII